MYFKSLGLYSPNWPNWKIIYSCTIYITTAYYRLTNLKYVFVAVKPLFDVTTLVI